jgi:hypothetical protein
VHLGNAEPAADLPLNHVAVEPHEQQALLAVRQLDQRPISGLKLRIARSSPT